MWWAAAGMLMLVLGCANKNNFACQESAQCVLAGERGVCEPQGFCSFPDAMCSGGRRYEPNAGDGLAGQCVIADGGISIDAPFVCGAIGTACCASTPACTGTGTCISGMCEQCVADVAPGRHTNCLIASNGTVWCAGENNFGQLGFGLAGPPQPSWSQVRDSLGNHVADATAISIGWEFACVIRAGGSLWCWGFNGDGQLGDNSTTIRYVAVQATRPPNNPLTNIVEVGAGNSHTCARDNAGGVWCMGKNDLGQLGDGTLVAKDQAVAVLDTPGGTAATGAVALSVGRHHNCLRKANNAVWCWGANTRGQLGDTTVINRVNPVMIGSAASVVAGRTHTCSLRLDGTVWCSGDSWRNRLGNGANNYDTSPAINATAVQVVTTPGGPALVGATAVTGHGEVCVVMLDSSVLCWGDSPHGQIGAGAGAITPVPVITDQGVPLTGVDKLVARYAHVCARTTNGTWYCWGRNTDGSLGDGTFLNRGVATPLRFTCP